MVKRDAQATYVFAAAMRNAPTTATFSGVTGTRATVLGEDRTIDVRDGAFRDAFGGYGVHLYRVE